MNITLYNRDELFVVHLESVAYFKAEDHFSRVFYINGTMYCCHLDSLIFVNTYVSVTIQVWLSCV